MIKIFYHGFFTLKKVIYNLILLYIHNQFIIQDHIVLLDKSMPDIKNSQKVYFLGDLYNLLFRYEDVYKHLIDELENRDRDGRNKPFYILINGKIITCYIQFADWINGEYPLQNLNHNNIINILNDFDVLHAYSATIGLICLNDLIDGNLENMIWHIKNNDLGLLFSVNNASTVELHEGEEEVDKIDCPYCNGIGKQTTDNKYGKTKKIKCNECNGTGVQVGKYTVWAHNIYVDNVNVLKVFS